MRFEKLIFVMVLTASGCCDQTGIEPTYSFQLEGRSLIGLGDGGRPVMWDGRNDGVSADLIDIRFARQTVFGPEQLVELYRDGVRAGVRGLIDRDFVGSNGDCPHDRVSYDLSALAGGDYTLVHRRSSAPDGYMAWDGGGEATWVSWEGEDALVATITRSPLPAADGGM